MLSLTLSPALFLVAFHVAPESELHLLYCDWALVALITLKRGIALMITKAHLWCWLWMCCFARRENSNAFVFWLLSVMFMNNSKMGREHEHLMDWKIKGLPGPQHPLPYGLWGARQSAPLCAGSWGRGSAQCNAVEMLCPSRHHLHTGVQDHWNGQVQQFLCSTNWRGENQQTPSTALPGHGPAPSKLSVLL